MIGLEVLAETCARLTADHTTARAELAIAIHQRDVARAAHDHQTTEHAAAVATLNMLLLAAENLPIEAAIATAYRSGRLIHARDEELRELPSPREARLRRIGREQGLAQLQLEIDQLAQVVPLGRRVATGADPNPRGPTLATGDQTADPLEAELQAVSKKTGQKIEELRAEAVRLRERARDGRR